MQQTLVYGVAPPHPQFVPLYELGIVNDPWGRRDFRTGGGTSSLLGSPSRPPGPCSCLRGNVNRTDSIRRDPQTPRTFGPRLPSVSPGPITRGRFTLLSQSRSRSVLEVPSDDKETPISQSKVLVLSPNLFSL